MNPLTDVIATGHGAGDRGRSSTRSAASFPDACVKAAAHVVRVGDPGRGFCEPTEHAERHRRRRATTAGRTKRQPAFEDGPPSLRRARSLDVSGGSPGSDSDAGVLLALSEFEVHHWAAWKGSPILVKPACRNVRSVPVNSAEPLTRVAVRASLSTGDRPGACAVLASMGNGCVKGGGGDPQIAVTLLAKQGTHRAVGSSAGSRRRPVRQTAWEGRSWHHQSPARWNSVDVGNEPRGYLRRVDLASKRVSIVEFFDGRVNEPAAPTPARIVTTATKCGPPRHPGLAGSPARSSRSR